MLPLDRFARATGHAGRHQLTEPFTPKHNGKVERYQRTLTEELLYARRWTSEADRAQAIEDWNMHYNYHPTPHRRREPATALPSAWRHQRHALIQLDRA